MDMASAVAEYRPSAAYSWIVSALSGLVVAVLAGLPGAALRNPALQYSAAAVAGVLGLTLANAALARSMVTCDGIDVTVIGPFSKCGVRVADVELVGTNRGRVALWRHGRRDPVLLPHWIRSRAMPARFLRLAVIASASAESSLRPEVIRSLWERMKDDA